jgi:hypothetical protein
VRDGNFLATLGPSPQLALAVYGRHPAAELAREVCDDAHPVHARGSFAAKPAIERRLEADREDDARRLRAHRDAEQMKVRHSAMT